MTNKTSDENVANEEITNNKNKYTYIKEVAERIVNEYREKYKDEKFYPEPSEQTCMAYEILHLLAEREQKDKRIQELEKESRKKSIVLICYQEKLENSIPTQVVIDKIKELKKRKNKYEYETQEIFSNAYYDRKRLEIIHKIDILQELLEGESK